MNLLATARQRWQAWTGEDETPLDGDTPAFVLSLLVHLGVLLGMAAMFNPREPSETPAQVAVLETNKIEELAPEEFEYSPGIHTEIGSNSLLGSGAALASAPLLSDLSQITAEEPEAAELTQVDVPTLLQMSTAPTVSQSIAVKGAAGVGATGASGAVDRITEEIRLSLEQRPTLVVWLFDQTLSMKPQRQAISQRFDRIYEELGVLGAIGERAVDQPLLTAVASFGQKLKFRLDEPTADLERIKAAVADIDNDVDRSGLEMVFGAVHGTVEKFQHFRTHAPRRNVLLVVVTDEAGDDAARLDATMGLCIRREIPVYVVGVPAPFGRRDVEVKFVDPDPQFDQREQWLPVTQGPESMLPEGIRLSFSGASRDDDYDRLDSGFGPYALTRLCYETSGIYFAVHPNRTETTRRVDPSETAVLSARLSHFFDPDIMQGYHPDYVSIKEYQRLLQENKARLALVQAAEFSQIGPMDNPRLIFPKGEEADFKRLLDDAQRAAAILEPKLVRMYQILEQGAKDRSKLTEPRWQAGYDLAIGRVLAVKVRTETYNAMLAKAKGGLKFSNPNSDTWVLVAANEITVGSALEKLARQAHEILQRVAVEHEGTPWGLMAKRELQEPIGWKWAERRVNYPKPQPQMVAGNGGPAGPAAPPMLNKLPPKPVRSNIRL